MKCDEGVLNWENVRISTVAARFNEFIVSKLVGICEDTLLSQGVKPDEFSLELTPGTLEIPMILNRMAVSGKYNAFIALWAVIHGSTNHYNCLFNEVSKRIMASPLQTNVPIMFGILKYYNIELGEF